MLRGQNAGGNSGIWSFPGAKFWGQSVAPAGGFLPFRKVCKPQEGLHTPGRSPHTSKVCTHQALEWKTLQRSGVFSTDALLIDSTEIVKCGHLCGANTGAE